MSKTKGFLFTAGMVLATAFTLSCEEKNADKPSATVADTGGTAVAPPQEKSGVIEFEKLVLKGDVHYLNNVPFTGTARRATLYSATWEMKDGKFHGKYEGGDGGEWTVGNYKDGKEHGEWKYVFGPIEEIRNYKDGKKHGEWKYFDDDKLEKTETYENDKLIKTVETEGTFTDPRDGKKYKAVKIGEQVWMAENLNFDAKGSKCFGEGGKVVIEIADEGNPITTTLSPSEVQANCSKYGRLYDWETAMKACPKGWHLPSDDEWDKLLRFVDGNTGSESPYNSEMAGKKLKAASGWEGNGNGTDEFGFSALPGGHFSALTGVGPYSDSYYFFDAGGTGDWWSATADDKSFAHSRIINAYYRVMRDIFSDAIRGSDDKTNFYSIRCIKDK